MNIVVVGIPVHFRDELQEPIRQGVRDFLEKSKVPFGDGVRLNLFGTFIAEQPLFIAFDDSPAVKALHVRLVEFVASLCAEHSKENGWWYHGFEINHLLEK